jgi:hypothetical protein
MNEPAHLVPSNPLETALVAAKKGELPVVQFLPVLLDSDVVVASANEVLPDGFGLRPLIFDRGGTAMIAIFSSAERAKPFEEQARHAFVVNARTFLAGLAPSAGVVLNPGWDVGLDLGPEGIRDILGDFAPPQA